ncbi:conserved phage C-terminal domain-containing protein [Atopobiaceae bacterium HCP3S3_D6]
MRVAIQEDMWEVMRALPGSQGDRLARALVEYGFTGEEPDPSPDPWYYAFLAFKGRVGLSARQSQGGSAGADRRWGREQEGDGTHDGCATDAHDGPGQDTHDGCVTGTHSGSAQDTHDRCATGTHDGSAKDTHDGCGPDTHHAESESESESESEKGMVGHGARQEALDASARFVARLNGLAGTSFSPASSQTLRLVSGRLSDGYTADDLCRVAEAKCAQWLRDPRMRGYLRPKTLLAAGNFEGYLQEARTSRSRSPDLSAYDAGAVVAGAAL